MGRPVEKSDELYRDWMLGNLAQAARHFELDIVGEPVFGWRLRSVGGVAQDRKGREFWLRVVSEYVEWAGGDTWSGNLDANIIEGVAKPQTVGVLEWDDDGWRRQRAEVATLLPGHPCSPTDALHRDIGLPDRWWTELRRTVEAIATVPTSRVSVSQERLSERIRGVFGEDIDLTITQWQTVHGDLHWSNLHAPEFGLLDWEFWGRGPAYTDAATLYCFSLMTPRTAGRVRDVLGDQLDTRAGRIAQIYVAARLLRRVDRGDFIELATPLQTYARRLLQHVR